MIKSKTTCTFEQDGEVFPLPFQVDDYLCKLVISEDGLTEPLHFAMYRGPVPAKVKPATLTPLGVAPSGPKPPTRS